MSLYDFNPETGEFEEKPRKGTLPIFEHDGERWSLGSWVRVQWWERTHFEGFEEGTTARIAIGLVTAIAKSERENPSGGEPWIVGVRFIEPCSENPPASFWPEQCAPCPPPEHLGDQSKNQPC